MVACQVSLIFPGRRKRVIYMFMAGGPSHIDLFDYKPIQRKLHGTELPDSVRQDQRLTGMSSGQKSFPCVAPMFEFGQYGEHQTLGEQGSSAAHCGGR
jgi:hypothetical protein